MYFIVHINTILVSAVDIWLCRETLHPASFARVDGCLRRQGMAGWASAGIGTGVVKKDPWSVWSLVSSLRRKWATTAPVVLRFGLHTKLHEMFFLSWGDKDLDSLVPWMYPRSFFQFHYQFACSDNCQFGTTSLDATTTNLRSEGQKEESTSGRRSGKVVSKDSYLKNHFWGPCVIPAESHHAKLSFCFIAFAVFDHCSTYRREGMKRGGVGSHPRLGGVKQKNSNNQKKMLRTSIRHLSIYGSLFNSSTSCKSKLLSLLPVYTHKRNKSPDSVIGCCVGHLFF